MHEWMKEWKKFTKNRDHGRSKVQGSAMSVLVPAWVNSRLTYADFFFKKQDLNLILTIVYDLTSDNVPRGKSLLLIFKQKT